MDKNTALKALSLDEGASNEAIEQAYSAKIQILEKRIDDAANDSLKNTFTELHERISQARDILLDIHVPLEAAQPGHMDIEADEEHDIHSFIKSQEKSAQRSRITVILLLAAALFIGIGWYTGFIQEMWERYRPLTAEESASLELTFAMQSDVGERKQSLTAARLILSQQLVQAEEEQSEQLPVLQETLVLADKSVFMSSKREALVEMELKAEQQIKDRQFFAAEKNYREVQTVLTELQETYEKVQVVPVSHFAARKVKQQWQELQKEYSLTAPAEAVEAEALWSAGEEKKEQEVYAESIDDYDAAKEKFLAAQAAVADEVARLKARLAASREARAAKRAKRLAWLQTITPKMVDIVGGSFFMGDASGDEDAQPVHKVELAAFRLSENEITKMRFQQFVKYSGYVSEAEKNADGLGCAVYNSDGSWGWRQGFNWKKTGFSQSDRDPVVCVSWNDAQAYVDWLSKEWKERRFKLVSESEWEYAARATGTSQYPMGETLGNNKTVCDGCGSIWDVKRTAPAGSFALNKFKLHAMPGNVWEWTRDCWHDNYTGAPKTNAAWDTGDECGRRVLRGGSWFNKQQYLQSAYRGSNKINYRGNNVGFRIAENDPKPVPDAKNLP